ncbi:hypothetical protein [Gimesia fumaroli]|uniref:Uncharacterized protein n=1 Tax=Gimesia fumaroli TaxID=2527976 RepID=A0A518IKU2_9PLAN|nr:hypothetical protein [Gimesia fumaroli]QDV53702.1 hypothetical protein Enr17x_57830 [Gimesia fumaroli]
MTVSVDDIAEAVSTDINGHDFGESFTTEIAYILKKSIENTRELTAVVLPRDEDSEPKTRQKDLFTFVVDVAVLRPATSIEPAAIKPFLVLPRSVRDFLKRSKPAGASWVQSTLKTPYSYDVLNADSILVSVIQNRYTLIQ